MRPIFLFVVLILSASCGKNGGGSSSSSPRSSTNENAECNLNGRAVACESLQGADGQGVDLLESMVDAPIEITGQKIIFKEDKSTLMKGRRILCETAVRSGETYSYTLMGDILIVETESGAQYEMKRLNQSEGLMGSWVWRGYVDEGTHVIKQLSFLGPNRVIMRTSCEL